MVQFVNSENLPLAKPTSDSARALEGIRVVLIEDSIDEANLLLFVLEEAGAEVTLLTEAETALEVIEKSHPDVLLIDIKLPAQNGDWLIQQIRAHHSQTVSHLPAAAFTAYLREVNAERLLDLGFNVFVSKLADPDELVAALSQML